MPRAIEPTNRRNPNTGLPIIKRKEAGRVSKLVFRILSRRAAGPGLKVHAKFSRSERKKGQ